MKKLLTQERLRQVLDIDLGAGVLVWKERGIEGFSSERSRRSWNAKNAGKVAGSIDGRVKHGYRIIGIDGALYAAHRLVWFYAHGQMPAQTIDHIDGNKLNNALANLRDVSQRDNCRNRAVRRDSKTGVTGVIIKPSGRYQAQIGLGGRTRPIGTYETLEAAQAARKHADRKYGYHENHGRISA
jgi:hypothetical protein